MTTTQEWARGSSPACRNLALLSVLALVSSGFHQLPPQQSVARCRRLRPAAYWTMGSPRSGTEKDATDHGHKGTYLGRPAATSLPNGDTAADFDGKTEYLQVKDAAELSTATKGVLPLEAWMRPNVLKFPVEGDDMRYMHWMGKGESNNHEYAARFYSETDNTKWKPYLRLSVQH